MDWLDKISLVLIIGLTFLVMGMIIMHTRQESIIQARALSNEGQKGGSAAIFDQTPYRVVEQLIEVGNYEQALREIEEFLQDDPQKGLTKIYQARILNRSGNLQKAIPIYRLALEQEPKLLDIASKELWELVQKGLPKLQREKTLRPDDEIIKNLLADLYIIQRKLGQGCE